MISFIEYKRPKLTFRIISAFIAFSFLLTSIAPPSTAQAQTILNLPVPGVMVIPTNAFHPPIVSGMTVHPENPLLFDFKIGRAHV